MSEKLITESDLKDSLLLDNKAIQRATAIEAEYHDISEEKTNHYLPKTEVKQEKEVKKNKEDE
jgi:hypothetical protein